MDTEEIWKDVVGFEGLYEVSSIGRVKSIGLGQNRRNVVLKNSFIGYGYLKCSLHKDGVQRNYRIHNLVAFAFLENPPASGEKMVIDHINGIRTENTPENLRFVTHRFNLSVGFRKDQKSLSSQYPGVSFNKKKKKWQTAICANGRRINLGCFYNESDAALAYQNELLKIQSQINL